MLSGGSSCKRQRHTLDAPGKKVKSEYLTWPAQLCMYFPIASIDMKDSSNSSWNERSGLDYSSLKTDKHLLPAWMTGEDKKKKYSSTFNKYRVLQNK